jgi:hypothetical protein
MTALTVMTEPAIRRLPVPVTEPAPILRVVRDDEWDVPYRVPGDVGVTEPLEDPAGRADRAPHSGEHRAHPVPPPPAAWARQFVQAALEAAAGRRPVNQLVRWTSEEVFSLLARRAALAARLGSTGNPPSGACLVRSVRLCRPTASTVEASAVVLDRGRYRAVALRLENADGRWRVTALEIG